MKRTANSLRLELAWIDLNLWIALALFTTAVLPAVVAFADPSRWVAVALAFESACCLLLVGVRTEWRSRVLLGL
jgi:hypothetical protein